ncbi:MAG: dual specificity protein phosphatase family protein [Candidatus Thermoplasmatota archaeon]|nr:dual specificity protein phosphatase family protein [Candidatus Thermoplasmatota archaeon]MEC8609303.1 dual specificity protein phosphatase family protein [Candidatus Thermoplasmatota archaeon]
MRLGKTDPITDIPNSQNWKLFRSPMPFGRFEQSHGAIINSWLDNEIDIVISTNPISEFIEKTGENKLIDIENHNFTIIHFPIQDRGVPSLSNLISLVEKILIELNENKRIVVHCSAGIGRTGMILACILIRSGDYSVSEAISQLSNLIPKIGPENKSQNDMIQQYFLHCHQYKSD